MGAKRQAWHFSNWRWALFVGALFCQAYMVKTLMKVAVLLLLYSLLAWFESGRLLKADVQQSHVYLVAKAPASLTTLWSRRNRDRDAVGALAQPVLRRRGVRVVVLVGQQGEGLRLLQPLLASLAATSPSMGTGLLVQNPWLVRLASTRGTKVCSFRPIITVVISCTMQGSQVLGTDLKVRVPVVLRLLQTSSLVRYLA